MTLTFRRRIYILLLTYLLTYLNLGTSRIRLSNYGFGLYRIGDKAIILVENRDFFHTALHSTPPLRGSCRNITVSFNTVYTVLQKTCDHVFDDKLNQNCPFTKIFGTLITKTMGHQQIFLFSHLTYLVQLLYLGKLI